VKIGYVNQIPPKIINIHPTKGAVHRLVGGSFIAAKADAEQYCICYNKVIKVVRTLS